MNSTPYKRVPVNQYFLPLAKLLVRDAWLVNVPRMSTLNYTEEGSS